MKRFALISSSLLLVGVIANAATLNKTAPVSANVVGATSFLADVKLTSNNSPAATLAFGDVGSNAAAWSTIPGQHVAVSVNSNSIAWYLRLTTKNFAVAPSTNSWGFQYGGLVGPAVVDPNPGAKVPLAWRASTQTAVGFTPTTGDPGANPTVGWTFIKDQADVDDPIAAGDSSFAWVDANTGYMKIAYGSASSTNVVALGPSVTAATQLPNATDTFKVFVEGNFNGAAAASYSTTLQFDLIYQ